MVLIYGIRNISLIYQMYHVYVYVYISKEEFEDFTLKYHFS